VASSKEIKKPKDAFGAPFVLPCHLVLASCHFQNFIVPQSRNLCVSLATSLNFRLLSHRQLANSLVRLFFIHVLVLDEQGLGLIDDLTVGQARTCCPVSDGGLVVRGTALGPCP